MVAVPLVLLCGLAGLAALGHGHSDRGGQPAHGSKHVIDSDTYFYGQSPPVYPTRMLPRRCPAPVALKLTADAANITSLGAWAAALAKARDLVSNMTLEEKARIQSLM